jgi:hypothetical protein
MRELKPFPLVTDRPAGGDDPAAAIRALSEMCRKLQRCNEHLAGQNITMLRLLAVQVIEHAGVLKIRKADVDAIPRHMGIKVDTAETHSVFYVSIIPCSCGANHECADNENQKP